MRIIILAFVFLSCTQDNTEPISSSQPYQFSQEPKQIFKLSKKLNEISGLAMSADGRLFAHDDESARINQIDYATGKITKSFFVGKKTLKKDFEGLAIVNDLFYLVTSDGVLYEFKEGEDGKHVKYDKIKTTLTQKNDVEGLCYDPTSGSLLLACKGDPGKGFAGYKTVYSFSLTEKTLSKQPILKIDTKKINVLVEKNVSEKLADFFLLSEKGFAPSGIELHPKRNTFFIVSAKGRMLLEITRNGDIIDLALLNKKIHPQPEGIAFTATGNLIIADEGGNRKASLCIYMYHENN
jgi:uncharacterized protein YjiK